jgi:Lon protease-like protein
MSETLLPLFPLQVVLFPTSVLPLHIFEERYKQLINECMEEEGKEFGINLAQEHEIAKVGCTAVVTQLLKRHDDGRMDILVQGERRYALHELVPSSRLYGVGKIEFLKPSEESVDAALAADTVRLHNQLIALVYRDNDYEIESDAANTMLSFRIAQKAGMELAQRQRLLELDSENERLKMLYQYFTVVIPKLEQLGEVERVIKSDGYIVN